MNTMVKCGLEQNKEFNILIRFQKFLLVYYKYNEL